MPGVRFTGSGIRQEFRHFSLIATKTYSYSGEMVLVLLLGSPRGIEYEYRRWLSTSTKIQSFQAIASKRLVVISEKCQIFRLFRFAISNGSSVSESLGDFRYGYFLRLRITTMSSDVSLTTVGASAS